MLSLVMDRRLLFSGAGILQPKGPQCPAGMDCPYTIHVQQAALDPDEVLLFP